MGGIADYSGSLVAEMPIAQAALCAAQAGGTDDGEVIVRSANAAAEGLTAEVVLPAEVFVNPVSLLKFLREAPREGRWAGYVAGCFALLRAEGLIPRKIGGRLFLHSSVPLGAGRFLIGGGGSGGDAGVVRGVRGGNGRPQPCPTVSARGK